MYLLARGIRVRKGRGNGVLRREIATEKKRLHYHAAIENAVLPKIHTKAFCNSLGLIIDTRV